MLGLIPTHDVVSDLEGDEGGELEVGAVREGGEGPYFELDLCGQSCEGVEW